MSERKPEVIELAGGEVYLWLESGGAIHLKAVSAYGDPVDLNADEAREIANALVKLADAYDKD